MTYYDHSKGPLGNLRWFMVAYISYIHIASAIGIYVLNQCMWQTLLFAIVLWPISGLGITGGAHRLWAHRSYKAAPSVRLLFMIFNSIANQGTIWHWSRDHRVHHKHSDTESDPHNAGRGFFFSHMGWLLVHKDEKVAVAGKKLNLDDLKADAFVMLQKKYDPWWNFFWCFFLPSVIPMTWGESFWNAYWVAGCLRYTLVLHFTWCVNSVAHFWGDRPYDPNMYPAENRWVSYVAVGEGWHNWHHKFPYDYAASEFGISAQFNLTKLVIDTFAKLGLVWDRKRGLDAWEISKKLRAEKQQKAAAESSFNSVAPQKAKAA